MNNDFRDDEIEILGIKKTKTDKVRKSKISWLIGLCIPLLLAYFLSVYFQLNTFSKKSISNVVTEKKTEITELKHKVEQASPLDSIIEGRIIKDTKVINDTSLSIYFLQNLTAQLTLGLPSDSISGKLLMLIPAADIRGDNGSILGECVINGKPYRGAKKPLGYAALLSGKLTLGIDSTSTVYEYVQQNGGSMFRHYSLVNKSLKQENDIKGRNYRRALATRGEQLFLIESVERISVGEFAEVLQDLRLDEAIFLRRYDNQNIPLYYRESTKKGWQGVKPQIDTLQQQTFLAFSSI